MSSLNIQPCLEILTNSIGNVDLSCHHIADKPQIFNK